MPGFFMYNGQLVPEGTAILGPNNRSFRYGDGLFETIRLSNGKMPIWPLHIERLWVGLAMLKFDLPTDFIPEKLAEDIIQTCSKNALPNARVRLTIFRGDGGLYDPQNHQPQYIIETAPLPTAIPPYNNNGLQIGYYEGGRKPADNFAQLKSCNFLLYAMAAIHAKEHAWDDAIVMNHFDRIADTSVANIFWTKHNEVFTNPISEGPISGVMRKQLLQQVSVKVKPLSMEALNGADEVFLTNAVRGIQWVGGIGKHQGLKHEISNSLYQDIILPLFS